MDQGKRRTHPYPVLGSCDADGLRASQLQHAVQHTDGDGHLGRLPPVRLRAQRVTDHPFVAADRRLDQSAKVVPGGLLSSHATRLGDCLQMPVVLRRCSHAYYNIAKMCCRRIDQDWATADRYVERC